MFHIMRNDQVRKWFQMAMGMLFVGSLASAMIPAYTGQLRPSNTAISPTAAAATQEADLQEQARGYELVLQREPQNPIALEGLAQTRLSLKDPAGAIAPLETLVQRYPERMDYQEWLSTARQQAHAPQP